MNTTTQQPAPSAQSATQSARNVLALLSDYAVRNELEKFFAREWEIATGLADAREALEARERELEERATSAEQYNDLAQEELSELRKAARDILGTIDNLPDPMTDDPVWIELSDDAKALKSLL